jgi:hypothetical protein
MKMSVLQGEPLRIGIDVGGTFTDLAAIDGQGRVRRRKILSTPDDPSRAVLEGLDLFLGDLGAEGSIPAEVVHGSTVATNAASQRLPPRVPVERRALIPAVRRDDREEAEVVGRPHRQLRHVHNQIVLRSCADMATGLKWAPAVAFPEVKQ